MRRVPWVAGCCGPDVEGHALGLELDVDPRVGRLAGDVGALLALGDGHRSGLRPATAGSSVWGSPGIGSTSTRPGQGFTSRASSGKSLRSGWPSKAPGR